MKNEPRILCGSVAVCWLVCCTALIFQQSRSHSSLHRWVFKEVRLKMSAYQATSYSFSRVLHLKSFFFGLSCSGFSMHSFIIESLVSFSLFSVVQDEGARLNRFAFASSSYYCEAKQWISIFTKIVFVGK